MIEMQVGDIVRYRSTTCRIKDFHGRIVKLLNHRVAVMVQTGPFAGTVKTLSRDSLFVLVKHGKRN